MLTKTYRRNATSKFLLHFHVDCLRSADALQELLRKHSQQTLKGKIIRTGDSKSELPSSQTLRARSRARARATY